MSDIPRSADQAYYAARPLPPLPAIAASPEYAAPPTQPGERRSADVAYYRGRCGSALSPNLMHFHGEPSAPAFAVASEPVAPPTSSPPTTVTEFLFDGPLPSALSSFAQGATEARQAPARKSGPAPAINLFPTSSSAAPEAPSVNLFSPFPPVTPETPGAAEIEEDAGDDVNDDGGEPPDIGA